MKYKTILVKKPVSLFILLFAAVALKAQTIDQLLDSAYEYEQTAPLKALTFYNEAWKKDSLNYFVHIGRGMLCLNLGSVDSSFEDLNNAVRLFPDSAQAYHCRALFFYSVMMPDESIADNTTAIELTKNDQLKEVSYINRGGARQSKRDFQGAYEDYSRALLLDTANLDILNNISTTLDELNRQDESIQYLLKIIHIDSTYFAAYINLGFQYSKLDKNKEAIEYFNKALKLKPDEPLTLNNRGYAKYSLKDYTGALEDINRSLQIYPANSYAYKNRALIYIALNKTEQACGDLKKAKQLGFTEMYGPEADDLLKRYCNK